MSTFQPAFSVSKSKVSLRADEIHFILVHGRQFTCERCEYVILSEADIPSALRHDKRIRRLINTVIVATSSGEACVFAKGRKAYKHLQKQGRQSRRPSQFEQAYYQATPS